MRRQRIDFVLEDKSIIQIHSDSHGLYYTLGNFRVIIPPHCLSALQFDSSDYITVFIDNINEIGHELFVDFLYNLIKIGIVKALKVNGKKANTIEEISKTLENDSTD